MCTPYRSDFFNTHRESQRCATAQKQNLNEDKRNIHKSLRFRNMKHGDLELKRNVHDFHFAAEKTVNDREGPGVQAL